MSEFKPGDIVQLKSGGPAMTVSNELRIGDLHCEWFDVDSKYQSQDFKPAALKVYEPPNLEVLGL